MKFVCRLGNESPNPQGLRVQVDEKPPKPSKYRRCRRDSEWITRYLDKGSSQDCLLRGYRYCPITPPCNGIPAQNWPSCRVPGDPPVAAGKRCGVFGDLCWILTILADIVADLARQVCRERKGGERQTTQGLTLCHLAKSKWSPGFSQ